MSTSLSKCIERKATGDHQRESVIASVSGVNLYFHCKTLVVHPPSSCRQWKTRNARLAVRAMSPPSSPHRGMLLRIPVDRCLLDRLLNLLPGFKAASLERQRLEGLPPRLNQVQLGRRCRLEDK